MSGASTSVYEFDSGSVVRGQHGYIVYGLHLLTKQVITLWGGGGGKQQT